MKHGKKVLEAYFFAQKFAALQKKAGPTPRKQIVTPESLICIDGPCLSAEKQTIEWLEVDAEPTDAFAGVSWYGLETTIFLRLFRHAHNVCLFDSIYSPT